MSSIQNLAVARIALNAYFDAIGDTLPVAATPVVWAFKYAWGQVLDFFIGRAADRAAADWIRNESARISRANVFTGELDSKIIAGELPVGTRLYRPPGKFEIGRFQFDVWPLAASIPILPPEPFKWRTVEDWKAYNVPTSPEYKARMALARFKAEQQDKARQAYNQTLLARSSGYKVGGSAYANPW